METLDCIKTRRSRRLLTNQDVKDDKIYQLLEAAVLAPSSMDCQPWEFVIVRADDVKKKLGELKGEDNLEIISSAPVLIIVCVDANKSPSRAVEDGVTATENILLAAHDIGLGSVYISGYKKGKEEYNHSICEILSLPEYIIPITILPVGYIDKGEILDKKELSKIEDVWHNNEW